MDQRRPFHYLLFQCILLIILVQCTSIPYQVEPLSRLGCVWSKNQNATTPFHVMAGNPRTHSDMALNCNVRTLNTEFWNYTFSLEQGQSTTNLHIKCNDKLYFESHFKLNTSFSQLVHLRSVAFDSCKIRKIPRGFWTRFQDLRSLSIFTRNSDWSPSIGLELEPNCFQGLTQLASLDLSSSNVWNLPESLFCPDLGNLIKVNLSSNRLIELPDEFGSTSGSIDSNVSASSTSSSGCALRLGNLDISRNAIRRVGKLALNRLTSLTQLRLQQNLIEELQDSAFAGLSSLRYLNLSSNRLVALPPSIFKSNSNLRELYLQNNSITALDSDVFSPLGQLVLLDLSANALSSLVIKESIFQSLVQCILIRLSYNQLTVIDTMIFKGLQNLQALYLSHNRIESIEPGALNSLTNLRLLDLSRNRLSSVDGRLLGNSYMLQTFFLDHNKITSLSPSTLANCSKLEDIGLSGNLFTQVPSALRTGLKSLRSLDLGENRIVTLSNESFMGLEEVYGLRLVDNRIEELPPGFCSSLKRLRVLNLAQNRISTVSGSALNGCRELRALRLDTNSLRQIPSLSQLPLLLWLNISENRIKKLEYSGLPRSLEWLELSHNALEFLVYGTENGQLKNSRSVQNFQLRVLDVSFNRLTHMDSNALLPSLETLRMNHNLISVIAPGTFRNSTHLRRIELVGNKLEVVPLSAVIFSPIPSSKPLPEMFLSGNPFRCDCSMDWLSPNNQRHLSAFRNLPRIMDSESIQCKLNDPQNSNIQNYLVSPQNLKPSQFLCSYTNHCPQDCYCCDFEACDCQLICPLNCSCVHDTLWSINIVQCSNSNYSAIPPRIPMSATEIRLDGNNISSLGSHVFIGKKNTRILFLNASGIERVKNKTFNGLRSLEILHLEDNLLSVVNGFEFQDLNSLRELYLQRNVLERIEGTPFVELRNLQVLNLQGNRLVHFNIWDLRNGHLNNIGISENPWSCECTFVVKFTSWVQSRPPSIGNDLDLTKCQLVEGNGTVEFNLIDICINELESVSGGVVDFDSSIVGQVGFGGAAEKQAVTHPHEVIPVVRPIDLDSSVILAIILCSLVGVILILALLWIFRNELMALRHRKPSFGNCVPSWLRFGAKNNNCSGGHPSESEAEKLFDAYFLYNVEDEELLREKIIPELEGENNGKIRVNRFRLCLQSDLCQGLENPWNLEMVVGAGEASKKIVILLSTSLVLKGTLNNDFRRALNTILSLHSKKVIFILLPPISTANLSSLLPILSELNYKQSFGSSENCFLEWTDPQFKSKLRRLLPVPSGTEAISACQPQNFSTIQSMLSHNGPQRPHQPCVPVWPPPHYNNLLKRQVAHWPHHHHHQHIHSNMADRNTGPPRPVLNGFCSSIPSTVHQPIMFTGQGCHVATHSHPSALVHEHQNSVSTISNTYPPLTEQNLSDSSNTLGSLGWEEHVYSTLDPPIELPKQENRTVRNSGSANRSIVNTSLQRSGESPSGQMYFV